MIQVPAKQASAELDKLLDKVAHGDILSRIAPGRL
jgi:hypothetical protein